MGLKKGVKQLWEEAMAEIVTIDAETAVSLHNQGDAVFVDIRDIRELQREGVIPGAIHAPRGMLEYWVDPDSPYHKEALSSGKQLVLF